VLVLRNEVVENGGSRGDSSRGGFPSGLKIIHAATNATSAAVTTKAMIFLRAIPVRTIIA
jgi:hypothetical protein